MRKKIQIRLLLYVQTIYKYAKWMSRQVTKAYKLITYHSFDSFGCLVAKCRSLRVGKYGDLVLPTMTHTSD